MQNVLEENKVFYVKSLDKLSILITSKVGLCSFEYGLFRQTKDFNSR